MHAEQMNNRTGEPTESSTDSMKGGKTPDMHKLTLQTRPESKWKIKEKHKRHETNNAG